MGQRRQNRYGRKPKTEEWWAGSAPETKHYEVRAGSAVLYSGRCTKAEADGILHAWRIRGYTFATLHVIDF